MNATLRWALRATAILLLLPLCSALVSAAPCSPASGAICYCLEDGVYKMYVAGGVTAGQAPAYAKVGWTPPGGAATAVGFSAMGNGRTASGSVSVPPGTTGVTLTVYGANCGPTAITLVPGQNYGSCTPCPYR